MATSHHGRNRGLCQKTWIKNRLRSQIPTYYYENAATKPERKTLRLHFDQESHEGLKDKLENPNWKPDSGPSEFNAAIMRTGATAVSARDFLVAYNINLNSTSTRRANSIAFDIREQRWSKARWRPYYRRNC
ncbi:MAG: hypothetical protein R2813_07535 [Flavobacteriales bacterium]